MKIQNVKGGYDFLPNEQKIRDYINNTIKQTFEEYGFYNIETPILCYYNILADKYDKNNDILKEIYKLKDQGNRNLALRYDLTVPFAKLVALNKNNISLPFKRYEIAKVFRDGPVKVGRDREFTQCDADVVGIKGQYIEAELLSLFVECFKKLKIDIIIKYNNRNLMNGLIIESEIKKELLPEVTTILDKIDKYNIDDINNMLKELNLNNKQINNLNNYFNMDFKTLKKTFKDTNNELINIGLNEINNLNNYLKAININKKCKFTINLARGQNYYTGNVFEVYEKKGLVKGSIGAGGRYDKIIGNFINDDNEYPAVGISFGLSSIYEILKNQNLFKNISQTNIFIIPLNTEKECLNLANKLRKMKYNVEIEMNQRKIKKSMDYANKEKIPYVIVLGENEIKNKSFIIKNMFNYKSSKIYFSNLQKLKKIIK